MAKSSNKRTFILAGVALALVGATIYDYTTNADDSPIKPATSNTPSQRQNQTDFKPKNNNLALELAELNYLIDNAPLVRAGYKAISIPYAESVAGFATLYEASEQAPEKIAKERLIALIPNTVKIDALLVSQPSVNHKSAYWLKANISFSSQDSVAFETALLTLGDATNGMRWEALNVESNVDNKSLVASGELSLLMIENAE